MTNKEQFSEYFRCKIELTDRVSYMRPIGVTMVGSTRVPDKIEVGEEKVYAIYLPESMLNDLLEINCEMINDAELRHKDMRLFQMYSQYKTLLNLLK